MAYELKRAKKVTEGVLVNGEEILPVIDLDSMAGEFTRRYNTVIKAEASIREAMGNGVTPENMEEVQKQYGTAIISIMELIFGEAGAAKIIAFYENKYIEMLTEVLPYILEVVYPAINAAVAEKRQKLANVHKAKQRNRFFRGGMR